jgi:glycosyltransferase involved in cell wall biosynthesis
MRNEGRTRAGEKCPRYHVALGYSIDLAKNQQEAELGKCPHHAMWDLSQRLNAKVHGPDSAPILAIDRFRALFFGDPQIWAMARTLATHLTSEDVVYCTGENVGVPIAALCGGRANSPKIVVFIHEINRLRTFLGAKFLGLADRVNLFITNCDHQVNFLQEAIGSAPDQVFLLLEQTDTQFFSPGVPMPKSRPIVASVGLERRDYRILAAVTADLDVDVKISGFSRDVKAMAQTFPKVLPPNMSRRFYEWTDLLQLYRDADVVVVSLLKSDVTSGVTTLLEAMACQCPVVVSRTVGLSNYLEPVGTLTQVEVGDRAALRQAILDLLQNPEKAKAQAICGYEWVKNGHDRAQYVETLAQLLEARSHG